MTFKEKVNLLLTEALAEKPSLFLIDLTITDAFKVIITLDDDNGVVLQDCIDISRSIDASLDREEQDYSMEVASAGVSSPLKKIRQYKKNIGRTLIVKTNTENIEAELVEANDDFVILSWKAREPKKIGKGKETVEKTLQIPYADIKEAIVTVTF
ncbi:ribosome assembly cofactor RimP [Flavobacterium sp. XN-5]|uniref:Ribosome maturation factor RimP n=1 Tax=Flavobacterium hiemivividum TaxID=2541734 RepID=A0A4V2Z1Z0_9FLAO|nr:MULTISPECIES: ribosome assembly cofactor RimP [Flavobacterium]NGY36303.1 ribosome assembly cofactor RimP [Flavobacterium sp. XN-5]TDE06828.1 ribosome assembly cofactor RimP [Flavobacterium hiemivividum]